MARERRTGSPTAAGGLLTGQVALVTGGSRSVGAAVVRALAAAGADVAFCYLHDRRNAARTARAAEACGRRVHAGECDIADIEAARHFVARASGALGPIDILVNTAHADAPRTFAALTVEAFDRLLAVNLRGAVFVTQAVYMGMAERGRGLIVSVVAPPAGTPGEGRVHACAANAGLIAFSRSLAEEAAPRGVRVVAIGDGETTATPAAAAASVVTLATGQ